MNKEDLLYAVQAATDNVPSDALLNELLDKFSSEIKSDQKLMSLADFRSMLTHGQLHPSHVGRYFVAVSLCEAETIRRILHVRKKKDPTHLIDRKDTEIALRYSAMSGPGAPLAGDGGMILDASWNWER